MPSATASGADSKSNGTAKPRDHNQGNQDRKYTVEQKAAVLRVRRCQPTAFYEILGLEEVKTTVTENEIKKAYRKLSLLTHPDKNGHEHADEAFKMVSRAFGVLGDSDKKKRYDQYGGDPDSRSGGGAPQRSPFSGFAQRTPSSNGAGGGGGGGMWEEEISPEEMFNRFFGGGGGFGPFGGGGFGGGDGFVFNLGGGGPGLRVHQFGGARPRRRPRDPNAPPEAPASLQSTIMGLLPLLIILFLPILSSFFSSPTDTGPYMRFDAAVPPHTYHRVSSRMKVDYYVSPADVGDYTPSQWSKLDKQAETTLIGRLNVECQREEQERQQLIQEAQGWFYPDEAKMRQASMMPMKACKRLDSLSRQR